MPNKNYIRGKVKEEMIVRTLKNQGYDVAQRSAGSHSLIDVFAIDIKNRVILLIQSKRTLTKPVMWTDPKIKEKLEKEHKDLNGYFDVRFEVR